MAAKTVPSSPASLSAGLRRLKLGRDPPAPDRAVLTVTTRCWALEEILRNLVRVMDWDTTGHSVE